MKKIQAPKQDLFAEMNNNRTRNYLITHMYSLSSKREFTQKKKEKANVNINATKLKFGVCDLISDNGTSKAKSHKDNISYYNNNTSNNRAKIESDLVKKIIEKIANDTVEKLLMKIRKILLTSI